MSTRARRRLVRRITLVVAPETDLDSPLSQRLHAVGRPSGLLEGLAPQMVWAVIRILPHTGLRHLGHVERRVLRQDLAAFPAYHVWHVLGLLGREARR